MRERETFGGDPACDPRHSARPGSDTPAGGGKAVFGLFCRALLEWWRHRRRRQAGAAEADRTNVPATELVRPVRGVEEDTLEPFPPWFHELGRTKTDEDRPSTPPDDQSPARPDETAADASRGEDLDALVDSLWAELQGRPSVTLDGSTSRPAEEQADEAQPKADDLDDDADQLGEADGEPQGEDGETNNLDENLAGENEDDATADAEPDAADDVGRCGDNGGEQDEADDWDGGADGDADGDGGSDAGWDSDADSGGGAGSDGDGGGSSGDSGEGE
jgi:hypothetical protein